MEAMHTQSAISDGAQAAARAVFDTVSKGFWNEAGWSLTWTQPELLLMVMSYLGIKDLTRSLSVSKHWQQTILGAVELRRILFLEPQRTAEEYLVIRHGPLPQRRETFIVREATLGSNMIVATHPVLEIQPGPRFYLDVTQFYNRFQSISPSTLLTQPPLPRLEVIVGHFFSFALQRKEGVTFGDLVTKLKQYGAWESELQNSVVKIKAYRVVASDATAVQDARKTLEHKYQD
jgi:hypothetical protein